MVGETPRSPHSQSIQSLLAKASHKRGRLGKRTPPTNPRPPENKDDANDDDGLADVDPIPPAASSPELRLRPDAMIASTISLLAAAALLKGAVAQSTSSAPILPTSTAAVATLQTAQMTSMAPMVPTATGSLTTVSTVPTVPCSPPKAQDNNLYTFTIQNSLPYNISAWVQIGCQGKFGSSLAAVTLPDGKSSVGVVNATSGQVYFIKSNDTNLAPNQILDVLVFAPAFNGLTWNITTASLGSTLDGNNTGSGGSSPSAVPYIVAAVIGGLGILAAIAVIGYFVYRKKRNGSSISSMFSKFNKKDGMSIGTPNNAEMSSTLDPVNRTGTLPPYGSMKRDNESSYGSSARLTNTIGRNNESSTGTLNKNGTYNRSQLAPAAQDNKRTSLLWWTTPSAGAAAAASTVSSSAAGATSPTTPTSPRSKEDIMVPGARLRVIHQHRASLEDELTLSPGDQVVLLESYGDGWCLARVVRSRRAHEGGSKVGEDGMVPVGCLDSADRTLTRGQGSGTTTEERSKRVKSLQRPESVALFMAAGRKPEDYYK